MNVRELEIQGLKLIELKRYSDDRGFFVERFNRDRFEENGLPFDFVQDNHSRSSVRVLRGLHYQHEPAQGKLVGCIRGRILDVAVDLRWDSPTFGRDVSVELNEENGYLLWIPAGFAHGFCVLGESPAEVIYKVNCVYRPQGEGAIHWADPELGIQWPFADPVLSPKDAQAASFGAYKQSELGKRKWWL